MSVLRSTLEVATYGGEQAELQRNKTSDTNLVRVLDAEFGRLARAEADAHVRLAHGRKANNDREQIALMEAAVEGWETAIMAYERHRQTEVLHIKATGSPSLSELQRVSQLQDERTREDAWRRRAEAERNRLLWRNGPPLNRNYGSHRSSNRA